VGVEIKIDIRSAEHALRVSTVFGLDGYDFCGDTRFDKLFTGIAVETPKWVKESTSRERCEDIGPEDTFDGDYGRLLEAGAMRVNSQD
jgi:hypothetical protein